MLKRNFSPHTPEQCLQSAQRNPLAPHNLEEILSAYPFLGEPLINVAAHFGSVSYDEDGVMLLEKMLLNGLTGYLSPQQESERAGGFLAGMLEPASIVLDHQLISYNESGAPVVWRPLDEPLSQFMLRSKDSQYLITPLARRPTPSATAALMMASRLFPQRCMNIVFRKLLTSVAL
jgi:hypothetical protein